MMPFLLFQYVCCFCLCGCMLITLSIIFYYALLIVLCNIDIKWKRQAEMYLQKGCKDKHCARKAAGLIATVITATRIPNHAPIKWSQTVITGITKLEHLPLKRPTKLNQVERFLQRKLQLHLLKN